MAERLFPSSFAADPDVALFTAYLDDVPVGTSITIRTGDISGVYAVITAPTARRRGIGTAAAWAAVNAGRKWGCRLVTLQATEMGFSSYAQDGLRNCRALHHVRLTAGHVIACDTARESGRLPRALTRRPRWCDRFRPQPVRYVRTGMSTPGREGLIGRDHPAAVLRAEIARAVDSHGGLVLVTGEAGIGKTTLVTRRGRGGPAARRAGAQRRPAGTPTARRATGRGCRWSGPAPGRHRRGVGGGRGRRWPGLRVLLGEAPTGPPDGRSRPVEPAEAFRLDDAVTTALVVGSQQPAGPGGPRRPALGRPGLAAAARVRRAAHLVRAAAAGRHLPRRRGGAAEHRCARCCCRWWPRRPR